MLTESWVEGKSVEEKDAQPTKRTAALWGLSSKIDSRIRVKFTRNGLRLGSRHQEPPHTVSVEEFGYLVILIRNLVVVRGVLPGLRRRTIGLLPSGPKSSFQMRASFVFHLETKVLEYGGRVEKLIAQVAWRPVLSFHSLWWFGVQCHLLVLVHFVFWKSTSLHPFTKTFWSTSCFLLLTSFLKMLISFSSRMWHLPTAKSSKSWLNDHDVGVLDWSANSPVLIPTENLWGIVKRKKRPKNADKLKATVKETGASIPPEQFHKLISSMPRWIEEEELFICHTHTIIQSITSSEMCCLHLTHPSAHNWSSGQQTLQRTGSSSVPCSRISHQSWTIPAGAEIRTHNLRLQVWCSIH